MNNIMVVALGSPVNYRLSAAQAGCLYKVIATDMYTGRKVGIKDIVTDSNGFASASFANLAIGSYQIQAFGQNCGKCTLPALMVDIILDCSVNNCTACNPGCSTTCSGNWDIQPRSFVAGIDTPTNYTLSGIPNCRVKILFFDGDTPVLDNTTQQQLFTYITNGQPNAVVLNWPGAVIGRDYNWRPAPSAQQDPCLQNCTISPARIDINIAGYAGNCNIAWDIQPRVLAQTQFATLSVTGAVPNCTVKFLQFDDTGAPIMVSGVQASVSVPIDNLGVGNLFLGPCTSAGTQKLRPATGSAQNSCAVNCAFDQAEIELTCGSGTVVGIPLSASCVDVSGTKYHRFVWTTNPAKTYRTQVSYDGGLTYADAGSPVSAMSTVTYDYAAASAGLVYRLKNVTDTTYSTGVAVLDCTGLPTGSWYCVSGTCLQSQSSPANSTGPYASQAACNSACGTPNTGTYVITLADQFSPAAGACSNVPNTSIVWEQGIPHSATLIVNGGASSAVNISGLPAWITRTDNSGSITLSGTPPDTSPFNLTVSAPGCTFTWANIISGGCNATWSISPTTFVHDVPTAVTYSAAGPAGCFIKIGAFVGTNPINDAFGNQIVVNIPCGSSIVTSNTWPNIAGVNWRVMPSQLSCLSGCNISPQQVNLTIT